MCVEKRKMEERDVKKVCVGGKVREIKRNDGRKADRYMEGVRKGER